MIFELSYENIEQKEKYNQLIERVLTKCFEKENIQPEKLWIEIILTNNETIRKINKTYRNIDQETDVLSFPMFERNDFPLKIQEKDILGNLVISIPKVEEQAKEYGHSFERELAYMIVHGFYHLMGYDHIKEEDKLVMRPKEEKVLERLGITREEIDEK